MVRLGSKRPGRRNKLVAAALLLSLLSSCFTVQLWGGSMEDTDGDGKPELSFSSPQSVGGDPASPNLATKILLTPIAVVLDICTVAIQAFIYGWGDKE